MNHPHVSIERLLARAEPLPVERSLPLALGAARAVAGLHQRLAVHGALTPSNLLVSELTGEVHVAAAGASSEPSESTRGGSLAYVAPEQTGRLNRPLDGRADLYALGVIFYRLFVGRLPFEAADPLAWVHCHLAQRPRPLMDLVPALPPLLSDVVLKLLAKLPEDRYQSAMGLVEDLARCAGEWREHGTISRFVLGERDWSGRLFRPLALYGREEETLELLSAWERVAAGGAPELVLVAGFAGVGKSSLVRQLHRSVAQRRGFFVAGKFDQHTREIPHLPLLQALRALVLEILAQRDDRVLAWRRELQEGLGPHAGVVVGLLPELELLLGAAAPASEPLLGGGERLVSLALGRLLGIVARDEHPLTIFLDDLQWAAPASLRLLVDLLASASGQRVLIVGTYRSNEVAPQHPLSAAVDESRRRGIAVRELELRPLGVEHLEHLIADSLRCPKELIAELARLVHAKTGGNPLFAVQFLTSLEERGLLVFDRAQGRWLFSLERIAAQDSSHGVADLLVGRLRLLPSATQEAVGRLACLGGTAEGPSFVTLTGHPGDFAGTILQPALEAGLLLDCQGEYRFPHDRVREAAYSLVPEHERAATHLTLGRLLLEATDAEQVDERIFEIAGQLNQGAVLIEAQEERNRLAELNGRAGRRAAVSGAFSIALAYLDTGISLLAFDAWESSHELAFGLHFEAARCALGDGDAAGALRRVAVLRGHVRTERHLADVDCLEINLFTALGDSEGAVAVALVGLRRFGIVWPTHPSHEQVLHEYRELEGRLRDVPIELIAELPRMEDPGALLLMRLLTAVHSAALFTDQNLLSLVACRKANLSLRHGLADSSGHAFSALAMLVGPVFGSYGEAPRWARLGRAVVDRGDCAFRARVYVDGSFSIQWSEHLQASRALLVQAREVAIQAGDLLFACYSHNLEVTLLIALGAPLAEVSRASDVALAFARRMGFTLVARIVAAQQRFLCDLQGPPARPLGSRDTEGPGRARPREAAGRGAAANAEPETETGIVACWSSIWELAARYLEGDYGEALRAGRAAEQLLWTSPSFVEASIFYYFHALTVAAALDGLPPALRSAELATLRRRAELLESWAALCPENFAHAHALVAAELARVEGQNERAAELYEGAVRTARASAFVHHEAIALEAASRFYRARGFGLVATAYLREARACYVRWGAGRKVAQLDRHHPGLAEAPRQRPSCSLERCTDSLDLLSIVKASQTVSSVTDRDQLLLTLLRVVLEQGGARTARLVFVRPGALTIEAEAAVDERGVTATLLGSQPVTDATPVSQSLLNCALRTKRSAVVDDTTSGRGTLFEDVYLRRVQPRSILCLPIVRQGEVTALLHLENDLVPSTFDAGRVAALELIASQAAISLENALLLGRERVARERAERLHEAHERAATQARFLAYASKALAESLDYRLTLSRLARLAVPFFADWCVVDVPEGGHARRIAGAHADPAMEATLQRLEGATLAAPEAAYPAARALATGEVCLVPEVTDEHVRCMATNEEHAEIVRALSPTSVVAVPIVARGEVLGAMTFASTRPGFRYDDAAVELAEGLAGRAAVAIENAKLYEAAQAAIRTRDEFLSAASHELRTPLTSLLLMVQGLGRGVVPLTPARAQQACARLERQALRLTKLVDEMLTVGRLHLGRLEPRLSDVDLVAVVRDVVECLDSSLAKAGCAVSTHMPEAVVGRWAEAELTQIVTNLLSNALKFGAGQPIEISVGADQGRAWLTVTDFGSGISADLLPQVFERFTQAASSRAYGGLGLGLYLVRELVAALGGSVRAESAPGQRTTFTVDLPLAGPGRS